MKQSYVYTKQFEYKQKLSQTELNLDWNQFSFNFTKLNFLFTQYFNGPIRVVMKCSKKRRREEFERQTSGFQKRQFYQVRHEFSYKNLFFIIPHSHFSGFYWGSPALMDPHLSQQLAGLQHPVLQEVTRPKARFKPTWPIRTYRLLRLN